MFLTSFSSILFYFTTLNLWHVDHTPTAESLTMCLKIKITAMCFPCLLKQTSSQASDWLNPQLSNMLSCYDWLIFHYVPKTLENQTLSYKPLLVFFQKTSFHLRVFVLTHSITYHTLHAGGHTMICNIAIYVHYSITTQLQSSCISIFIRFVFKNK